MRKTIIKSTRTNIPWQYKQTKTLETIQYKEMIDKLWLNGILHYSEN